LKNLEENFKNLHSITFRKTVDNFEAELENSKFSKFQSLKERVFNISDWKFLVLSDKIQKIETDNSALRTELRELSNSLTFRNPWMILAIGIGGFTQFIILAVIIKELIA